MTDDLGVYRRGVYTKDVRTSDMLILPPTAAESAEALERLLQLIRFDEGKVWDALAGGVMHQLSGDDKETFFKAMEEKSGVQTSTTRTWVTGDSTRAYYDKEHAKIRAMNKSNREAWSR
jgi:hypothetical protein